MMEQLTEKQELGNVKDDDSGPRQVQSAWRVEVPLAAPEAGRARAVAVDEEAHSPTTGTASNVQGDHSGRSQPPVDQSYVLV